VQNYILYTFEDFAIISLEVCNKLIYSAPYDRNQTNPGGDGECPDPEGNFLAGTESASDFVSDDAHPPRDLHSNNQEIILNGHRPLDLMVDSNHASQRFRGRREPRS
jgi:hypothetical protein